jgi:hypothetical protein
MVGARATKKGSCITTIKDTSNLTSFRLKAWQVSVFLSWSWLLLRTNATLPIPKLLEPYLSQVRPNAFLNAFATPVAMHLVAKNAESFFTVGFASTRFLFFQAKQVQAATLLVVSTGGTVSLIQSSQRGRDLQCNTDVQQDPNFHEK